MKKIKVSVVVPTIREESIVRFLREWKDEFFNNSEFSVKIILVEDNPKKKFKIKGNKSIFHYDWQDVDRDLGQNSWIIPRRSDCIRSYGYWKAWQGKPDMIVTLDDDCYPLNKYYHDQNNPTIKKGFLKTHWERITNGIITTSDTWVSTIIDERPRGLPYLKRTKDSLIQNVILNHGLWYNVPDFDARTQLGLSKIEGLTGFEINQVIPKNIYYPMCGMNLAWKPSATPALYFLLMGQGKKGDLWGFDRFGDIWAGVIFKKIADHLGYAVGSGYPIIWHSRASNVFANLKKEASGMEVNETFWQVIDSIKLKGQNFQECYLEIASKLSIEGTYWETLKKAMKVWGNLFD